MTFAHPFVLAVIPFALVAVWFVIRNGGATEGLTLPNIHRLWADFRGLADKPAATRNRRLRGVLLAAGAVLALVALARPQWGEVPEQSFDQSREVLLALDLSRSMLADDVSPNRLARAKLLIDALLDQLRGERVGLLVFAGTAFTQSPLSADYEVLRDFLAELDPSYLPQGGSNYEAMLSAAIQAFGQQGGGDRFLVVLSDGEAHDDGWKAMLPALRDQGIRVIGLGVGTPAGALVPAAAGGALKDAQGNAVLSRLEPATLQELASATGGTYRDAASWVDIAALVDATVEQGRKGQYVEDRRLRLQDRFEWFLAPALVLLMLGFWLDFPLSPIQRARQARGRRPQPASSAAAAALLALVVSSQTPGLARAAVSDAPPPPDAVAPQTNALETTVAELMDKPTLVPPDYARLASETIQFASQPNAPQGAPRAGVLDDALAAVDRGEHLDAQAADWPTLRAELERLKQQEEPQQEQQAQQEQNDQQPQQDQQTGQGEQQQDSSGQQGQQEQQNEQQAGSGQQQNQPGSEGNQSEQAKSDQPSPDQQQAGDEGEPRDSDQHTDDQSGDPEQNAAAQNQQGSGDSADEQNNGEVGREDEAKPLEAAGLGEEHEPQPTEAEQQDAAAAQEQRKQEAAPQQPSRMVGGGRAMQEAEAQGDVALAEVMGRMQHVKEGDSPAVLFDRMNRADGQPRSNPSSKDW